MLFFRYFKDGDAEYLARSWLVDPVEAELRGRRSSQPLDPWNGQDFYVSFGEREHRNWEDARRYGFISAGQGRWHSRTLDQLQPGQRVFVYIAQRGYVGVGTVRQQAVPVRDFTVTNDIRDPTPILGEPLLAAKMGEHADDPELCEYLVASTGQPPSQSNEPSGKAACSRTKTRLQTPATPHPHHPQQPLQPPRRPGLTLRRRSAPASAGGPY